MNRNLRNLYGRGKAGKTNVQRAISENQNTTDLKENNESLADKYLQFDSSFPRNSKNLCSFTWISETVQYIKLLMEYLMLPNSDLHSKTRGIVISGPMGSGKTCLAESIAADIGYNFYKLSMSRLFSSLTGKSEKILRDVFEKICCEECVLLIDDIDVLFKKTTNQSSDTLESRIVYQLASCMDSLHRNENSRAVVIITSCNINWIDPMLRRSGRFENEISIGVLNYESRCSAFRQVFSELEVTTCVSIENLACMTPGFVCADIITLIHRCIFYSFNRSANKKALPRDFNQDDFEDALKEVKPGTMKEGFTDISGVSWKDVGALESVKEELRLSVLGPIKYRQLFIETGISMSAGILFYGPPGCGKTLLAKALANEGGINFVSIRGPEILSMYVGESERTLRDIFSRARSSAPCIIFLDEIDSICTKRTKDENNSARLVNQLLTEMDGQLQRCGVTIIAATNRPDILDPAVLRPGRFDKLIYVGIPTEEEREAILGAITHNFTKPKISRALVRIIVSLTENFTGADIGNFVKEASLNIIARSIKENTVHSLKNKILPDDIDIARSKVRSSVSTEDIIYYENLQDRFS